MYVRQATIEDAAVIYDVMIQAFREYEVENPPSSALQETVATITFAMTEGEKALVVYEADIPIAAVRYTLLAEELYFYRLSVIPDCRGRGIAKYILQQLEQVAASYKKQRLYCKVRMNVMKNVALYQACGFQLVHHEILYRVNSSAIDVGHMKKSLG